MTVGLAASEVHKKEKAFVPSLLGLNRDYVHLFSVTWYSMLSWIWCIMLGSWLVVIQWIHQLVSVFECCLSWTTAPNDLNILLADCDVHALLFR
jgi:hypothetical protein